MRQIIPTLLNFQLESKIKDKINDTSPVNLLINHELILLVRKLG